MSKNTNETKLCKHCKTEIPSSAKVCPNCRKKQGGKIKWIIIAAIVLIIIAGAAGGGGDKTETKDTSDTTAPVKEAVKEEKIEYTSYQVDEMMNDLTSNAMSASQKYKDQYIEVTGRLGTIDSSGKYISLYPLNDEFAFIGVQCYLKNDEQKEIVATLKTNDTVTLRGKCTDVGEVLGYSLDIDSIN